MSYNKLQLKNIIIAVTLLLLISPCFLFACKNPTESHVFNFDKMRLDALKQLNEEYNRDYTGYGYYTIMIDEYYNMTSIMITFPLIFDDKINGIYEVGFDINGVVKYGKYIYNTNSYYEKYKNEDGIFIVKGIYGTYILRNDDTLVYTGNMHELDNGDIINPDVFNVDFVRQKYGIDISNLSNKIITEMNDKLQKSD